MPGSSRIRTPSATRPIAPATEGGGDAPGAGRASHTPARHASPPARPSCPVAVAGDDGARCPRVAAPGPAGHPGTPSTRPRLPLRGPPARAAAAISRPRVTSTASVTPPTSRPIPSCRAVRRLSSESSSAPPAAMAAQHGEHPRGGVDPSGHLHDVDHGAAGVQREQRRRPLGPDPSGRGGSKPFQHALDEHPEIGDGDQNSPVASPYHGVVRLQQRPAKQSRERLTPDDPSGERTHQRPHRHEIPSADSRDRVGHMIRHVGLDRRVAQRRDRTVGERTGAKHRAAGVRQRHGQDREQHRHRHQRAHAQASAGRASLIAGRHGFAWLH